MLMFSTKVAATFFCAISGLAALEHSFSLELNGEGDIQPITVEAEGASPSGAAAAMQLEDYVQDQLAAQNKARHDNKLIDRCPSNCNDGSNGEGTGCHNCAVTPKVLDKGVFRCGTDQDCVDFAQVSPNPLWARNNSCYDIPIQFLWCNSEYMTDHPSPSTHRFHAEKRRRNNRCYGAGYQAGIRSSDGICKTE